MAKETKTINFGITEEAMKYLEEMTIKYGEKDSDEKKENKKVAYEAKAITVEIIKDEIQKIGEKIKKTSIGSDDWNELISPLDKAVDVIRYM